MLRIDSRSTWRVNPEKIGQLYTSWKDLPLDGRFNGDISTLVVRGLAQGAIVQSCSTTPGRRSSAGRDGFVAVAENQLTADMARANLS